jgi:hypothetical protein
MDGMTYLEATPIKKYGNICNSFSIYIPQNSDSSFMVEL